MFQSDRVYIFEKNKHGNFDNTYEWCASKVSPQNRTIVVLRYCEDMKLEDIALAVNENLSTVKTRLYRSLKKLRINLEAPDTN